MSFSEIFYTTIVSKFSWQSWNEVQKYLRWYIKCMHQWSSSLQNFLANWKQQLMALKSGFWIWYDNNVNRFPKEINIYHNLIYLWPETLKTIIRIEMLFAALNNKSKNIQQVRLIIAREFLNRRFFKDLWRNYISKQFSFTVVMCSNSASSRSNAFCKGHQSNSTKRLLLSNRCQIAQKCNPCPAIKLKTDKLIPSKKKKKKLTY